MKYKCISTSLFATYAETIGSMHIAPSIIKQGDSMDKFHCKTKVILSGEKDFFGPGIYYLLEYIDETGSIQRNRHKTDNQ